MAQLFNIWIISDLTITYIYRPAVYCTIPQLIITTLTVVLVIKLKTKNKRLPNMMGVQRQKSNATKVLIVVNIVFVVCSLPWPVAHLLRLLGKTGSIYDFLYNSIYFFHILNSSVNVLIYTVLSKHYREVVMQNVCCTLLRTQSNATLVGLNIHAENVEDEAVKNYRKNDVVTYNIKI